jgi:hypothetical protein
MTTTHIQGVIMNATNWRNLRAAAAVMTLFSVSVLTGCESAKTPATDGGISGGTSINLSASTTVLATASSALIEASVATDGSPNAGLLVTFSMSPTSLGNLSPSVDTTDGAGTAVCTFQATNSGTVTITASINGGAITRSILLTVTAGGGGGGTSNVQVSATPSLIFAGGGDSATLNIAVADAAGQPAPESTIVRLAAGEYFIDNDNNGTWSPGADSLVYDANANGTWDALGSIPAVVYTNSSGTASARYASGPNAGTVYIKASVNDNGISGTKDIQVQVNPTTSIYSIYLASDTVQLSVKGTGGVEASTVRAIGYDVYGNRVPEGVAINFFIVSGPSDPGDPDKESLGNAGYGPYQAVTNGQGVAVAPIRSGFTSGTVRIRAQADSAISEATQVLVAAGPPYRIVVAGEECNVPFWRVVNGENKIIAIVSDEYNNPVNDSTVVYFTTDEGTVQATQARTFGHEGRAKSLWMSGMNIDAIDPGIVRIVAETGGGTVADTGYFYNSYVIDTLIVSGMPLTMNANASSKASVTVTGLDLNGNPVDFGTLYDAAGNYITVSGGSLEDGCASSSSGSTLTGKSLDLDYSLTGANDNGIGAVDTVAFYSKSGARTRFAVSLLTGSAYTGNSSIQAPGTAGISEQVRFFVRIADRWGNPLGDHTLVLTASGGTISGGTQETNEYGEADGFVWTAPATLGDYNLTITDTDPRGNITLVKKITVE